MDTVKNEVIQEIREKMALLQQEISTRQAKLDEWQRVVDLMRDSDVQQLPLTKTGRFATISAVGATAILLKEEGRPLHVSEILPLLQAGGWTSNAKTPTTTLSAMLYRSGKFVKKAPGVYALPSEAAATAATGTEAVAVAGSGVSREAMAIFGGTAAAAT